ncbi:MAG TPA: addiction module toxin RelE [Pseudomonadota bacterium]|nr:addiction module toxin RelE [Pseudomonadota bacterium]
MRLPGRGKRGGARVIYAVVLRATALALLDVYAKSEQENLSAAECKIISALIREVEAGFEP